jgi:hypothetical protein
MSYYNLSKVIKGVKPERCVRMNMVSCPPVVTVIIKRPDLRHQLGFSVQNGIICSLMRGGIAEKGGVRVGHRIIEINGKILEVAFFSYLLHRNFLSYEVKYLKKSIHGQKNYIFLHFYSI